MWSKHKPAEMTRLQKRKLEMPDSDTVWRSCYQCRERRAMLPGRYFKGSKSASIYICIGAAKKTWMNALHASHQWMIELPAYIVQEPHIHGLTTSRSCRHTLQAMQALHTPVKHGLHHTSQLLPSCVYYMVWWVTYGPACQWLQSERKKGNHNMTELFARVWG